MPTTISSTMSSFREHFPLRRAPRASLPGSTGATADEAQTAYERRRAQVRRAQRNHRERKANYIKALESEVVNLRKQNQQNIVSLEGEVSTLRQMLLACGVDPPPRQARVINASDEPVDAGPSSYTVTKPSGLGSPLQVLMPETNPQESQSQASLEGSSTQAGAAGSSVPSESPTPFVSPLESTTSPALAHLMSTGALDKIVGIDFVLALEHPCMAHPDMTRDEFGTHSHMASHTLLMYAPQNVEGAASWEVPGADITRLLSMSNNFQLQGEITPVQAWYRLKQHPRFADLTQSQVEALKRLLFSTVKCYGFGSVMEESDWNIAVEEIIARG